MVDGHSASVLTGRRLTGDAQVRFTGRSEGDLAGSGPEVAARRRSVVDLPWTLLRQVHGAEVVVVDKPGAGFGQAADAAVTRRPGIALAVLTADCAPVALTSDEGVIAVAHAGWRGLAAGVVAATVDAMRAEGAQTITAVIGPCIRPRCYPFGAADLDAVVASTGPEVASRDDAGRPALDLVAGVAAALRRAGVADVADIGTCTACSADHWSFRARQDAARQATVVWRT